MIDNMPGGMRRFAERAQDLVALLDSLDDQFAVIDGNGVIHYTNLA